MAYCHFHRHMLQFNTMKKIKFLISFLFVIFFKVTLLAQALPGTQWKVRHLEHFDLIYDATHQELADLYAFQLEHIASMLHPYYPKHEDRTAIVLIDRTDQVNGYATPFPYSMIQLYPVLPGPMDSIGEYNDWTWELLTHEYTHILAIEPRRGVVSALQYVFGSIMVPNILLPRWWHEGLAVDSETRFSSGGRLRSIYQDASITGLIKDDRWSKVTLSEINESFIPTWPYGSRPYLYGSLMWSYMIQKYQMGITHDLTWSYGGRVPYLMNDPARQYLNTEYEALFREAMQDTRARVEKRLANLRKVHTTQSQSLDLPFVESMAPALSPDGLKLAFISKDETLRRRIQIFKRPNLQTPFSKEYLMKALDYANGDGTSGAVPDLPRRIEDDAPPGGAIQRLSWFPDSNRLIYDKLELENRFEERFEIHVYDLSKGESKVINEDIRAREPTISPDSQWMAYVKAEAGSSSLGLYNLQDNSSKVIFQAKLNQRVSHPVFLNEKEVLFSFKAPGDEYLMVVDISTHQAKIFSKLLPSLRFPYVTEKGIYATSSKNGIHNLYWLSKDGTKSKVLTNSETSVYASVIDPELNDLYITEMTGRGFSLARIPAAELSQTPENIPVVEPIFADRYKFYNVPVYDKKTAKLSPEDDYSPLWYLWPRWWIPSLWSTGKNTYASLLTAGADPLHRHAYSLFLGWDDNSNYGSHAITYINNSTWFEIPATTLDLKVNRAGTLSENRTRAQAIDFNKELLFWSPYAKAGLGYVQIYRDQDNYSTKQRGPRLNFSYANLQMSGNMVSPESGWGLSTRSTRFLPQSEFTEYNQFEASLVGYFSKYLPPRHAIMAKVSGQYVDREIPSSNYAATTQLAVYANTEVPQYLLRGFISGTLQGRTLVTSNLEYRFPLFETNKGWGVVPAFIKRFYGSVIADAAQVNGYGYDSNVSLYKTVPSNLWYYNSGAELKMDMTIGYHFPMTLYLGAYAPAANNLNQTNILYVIGSQM